MSIDLDGPGLTEIAAEQQRRFDAATPPCKRKEQGHFGTPATIAEFMASMFGQLPIKKIRILDPGAGVGTLSAAICQRIVNDPSQRHMIHFNGDKFLGPYPQRI